MYFSINVYVKLKIYLAECNVTSSLCSCFSGNFSAFPWFTRCYTLCMQLVRMINCNASELFVFASCNVRLSHRREWGKFRVYLYLRLSSTVLGCHGITSRAARLRNRRQRLSAPRARGGTLPDEVRKCKQYDS